MDTAPRTHNDIHALVLVYRDEAGEEYEQPAIEVTSSGTLIDPEDGTDLTLVGWRARARDTNDFLDAVEGEAWLLTVKTPSGGLMETPAIYQAGDFRDHGGYWGVHEIEHGVRLWAPKAPEAS